MGVRNMFKAILNNLLARIGLANLGLRIGETILRNYSFSEVIPYQGWTNNIIDQLKKISDDGKFTNSEAAEFIAYIRTLIPQNIYADLALRVSETILRNVQYSFAIPYPGWTNDIVNEFQKVAEDGEVTNVELADFVRFIRENR